ncbi:hypothetical protein NMA510612_1038 [Neisseria meningitidis]|uniref:Uncharacterized protein n=1 Tax=Neisseria meningitidis TaxID=487 RepID=X5F863_NEIME|nr:hypothetical protein NMA510612_1038 [Neisseria meningitidis]
MSVGRQGAKYVLKDGIINDFPRFFRRHPQILPQCCIKKRTYLLQKLKRPDKMQKFFEGT